MSIQREIENALGIIWDGTLPGWNIYYGPRALSMIEGDLPAVVIRQRTTTATKLVHAQWDAEDLIDLTAYWDATVVDRDTRIEEWEAFIAALSDIPTLSGPPPPGVYDSMLTANEWGEAHDAKVATMTAEITVYRIGGAPEVS